jgi:cellulose synthase/poly-beta-1,6-N-acetylglucosamine synthase-like glycosyltransferase
LSLAFTLLGIGSVGFLGMTVVFPLTAALFVRKPQSPKSNETSCRLSQGLDILIPAHNEAQVLPGTIESVNRAIFAFRKVHPAFRSRILVGADACTDATVENARRLGVDVLEFPENHSKWKTLGDLLRAESAKRSAWVALVDAGAVWPEDLLLRLEATHSNREASVGLAPAYEPRAGGRAESSHWRAERFLKTLECDFGNGPVSVHGASVLYRRDALLSAYERLERVSRGAPWLNDDVAIPLALRIDCPGARIEYVSGAVVGDVGVKANAVHSEARRRRRLARGNAQWIRALLLTTLRADPGSAITALRRVFRWLWAWWAAALAVGALAGVGTPFSVIAALALLAYGLATLWAPRPLAAAIAAFRAPLDLLGDPFRRKQRAGENWT